MGSITPYDTAAGKRYRVRYRKPDHTQTDKRGFKTKRQAQLFLASTEVSKSRGEYIDSAAGRARIDELGDAWLNGQSHLKPSSLRPVEIAWRVHVRPRWGLVAANSVMHSDVQSWVTELTRGKSPTTVLRAYGVLAAILDTAVKDRRLSSNPARDLKLPRKVKKEHRYLTHEQVFSLASASENKSTLVLLLAYTGLRWGEAAGLRVKDIDSTRNRISVVQNAVEVGGKIEVGTPKSHKCRSVGFPGFLTPLIDAECGNKSCDDLVFPGPDGQHMRRTRVSGGSRSWFKSALKAANLPPMTLHDLRHTAASLAVSSGANVKAVQRMLGHASAAMTLDVYADLFEDDIDSVAKCLNDAVKQFKCGQNVGTFGFSTEGRREIPRK